MKPQWSYTISHDLRVKLDAAMSARNCGAPEVWAEVVDWLRLHGVEPPDHPLPEAPPFDGTKG